ncbi:hypothetical protein KPL40_16815 [Clostridium gasigenes]|uniref:hypothetical protein n=1 Tax=Clostridium gasigenes TaxID=94869 RepID=UPI001C0D7E5B|nr:hypothetical protein [Clostridium gasigenes]MBU3134091.1 hypothetical protein [Clostridium gasigenes]
MIYLLVLPLIGDFFKSFIFLFLLYIFIEFIIKKEIHWETILKLIILTPVGSHAMFYNFKGVNFSELIMLTIALVCLIRLTIYQYIRCEKIKFLDVVMILFAIYVFVNNLVSKNNASNKLMDLRTFCFWFMLYFIIKSYYSKNSFDNFIKLLTDSIILSSVVIIVIYYFKIDSIATMLDWEGRYGNAFQTLYIVALPNCIHYISNDIVKKREKLFYILGAIIIMYLMSINGGRTITIGVSIATLYIVLKIILESFKSGSAKKIILNITFIFASIIICTLLFKYLAANNSFIITRLMDLINNSNSGLNVDTRIITNMNSKSLITDNMFGYGIGSQMNMINHVGEIYSERAFIDNAFISLTYKFGIVFITLFICVILIYLVKEIKNIIIYKSNVYIMINFILILVTGGVFTSQIITNFPMAITFFALLLYMDDKKNETMNNDFKENIDC